MIELKVQCDCGQKYKFDVEPLNGRMPFTVACPICGADGTAKANALLQEMPEFQPGQTPPPPPPIAPAAAPARLRVNISARAPAAAPAPISPLAPAGTAPPPIGAIARPAPVNAAAKSGKPPNFWLGLLGGLLGTLVGAAIYYAVFKLTGWRIGLLAIGVGALAGWSADFLGRGEGSKELGGITAIMVIAGVVAAQYLVALGWWHNLVRDVEDAGYTASVTEAREAVKAVPTGSEAEIRTYLAKQAVDDGEKPDPGSVSADDVKQFREKQLPEFRNLASGKETKQQYLAKNGFNADDEKKMQDTAEGTFKGVFLLLLLSKVGIISLIAGAGVAYKLSTNA
jgi:hypothetical protein